jgi:hypothetical protein
MDERERDLDELKERAERDAEELRHAAMKRGSQLRDAAFSFVQEHPYAAVGAAFGVGYLVSGALLSRSTFRLLGIGGRLFAGALIKQLIASGGLGLVSSLAPDVQQREPSPGPSTKH